MKLLRNLFAVCVISLFTSSCSPKYAYEERVAYFDYELITSMTGVFLTEAPSYYQPYKSLGSVSVFTQDGYLATIITNAKDTTSDPIYGQIIDPKKYKIKYGDYKLASASETLLLAAEKAKEMGANGIINLKLSIHAGNRRAGIPTSFSVTGLAVKTNQ